MKTLFSKTQSTYWDGYTQHIETLDLDKLSRAESIELEFFLKTLGPLKNKKVLDLGCGTGRWGLQIARIAKEVVGVDISKHSIGIAKRTAKKYGIGNFKGIVDDFKSAGFKNEFDLVILVNLIHHTDDIDTILECVRKALKPNGKLVIFEVNPLNPLYYPFFILVGQLMSHLTFEFWRSNVITLTSILNKNSLKVVRTDKWCYLPTMLYNYSLFFQKVNESLNKIPVVNWFCAFHIITASK